MSHAWHWQYTAVNSMRLHYTLLYTVYHSVYNCTMYIVLLHKSLPDRQTKTKVWDLMWSDETEGWKSYSLDWLSCHTTLSVTARANNVQYGNGSQQQTINDNAQKILSPFLTKVKRSLAVVIQLLRLQLFFETNQCKLLQLKIALYFLLCPDPKLANIWWLLLLSTRRFGLISLNTKKPSPIIKSKLLNNTLV